MTNNHDECPIVALVRDDLLARSRLGMKKYGVNLGRRDLTPRQWQQHAYEEALDLALYLRRIMEESDMSQNHVLPLAQDSEIT